MTTPLGSSRLVEGLVCSFLCSFGRLLDSNQRLLGSGRVPEAIDGPNQLVNQLLQGSGILLPGMVDQPLSIIASDDVVITKVLSKHTLSGNMSPTT